MLQRWSSTWAAVKVWRRGYIGCTLTDWDIIIMVIICCNCGLLMAWKLDCTQQLQVTFNFWLLSCLCFQQCMAHDCRCKEHIRYCRNGDYSICELYSPKTLFFHHWFPKFPHQYNITLTNIMIIWLRYQVVIKLSSKLTMIITEVLSRLPWSNTTGLTVGY